MSTVLVTGSGGLVGSEAVRHFHELGWDVVGIDNDMRRVFFGSEGSTRRIVERLTRDLARYSHAELDIRDPSAVDRLVRRVGLDLELVVHAAGQPSHEWAGLQPAMDFAVNAQGTLVMLEAVRNHAPEAVFVFMSTNKVYGDGPNRLPLIELETRLDLPPDHECFGGIGETMPIDQVTHSLFGVSKTAADLLVQEYGRYFGLQTVALRAGCVTGSAHAAVEPHGFLAYLVRCTAAGRRYTVYGHRAKQVRDVLHSADLAAAIGWIATAPTSGAVYNIGGGRPASCSMLEAIELSERVTGRILDWSYEPRTRTGDHAWWISDTWAFRADYPGWEIQHDLESMVEEIHDSSSVRGGRKIGARPAEQASVPVSTPAS